MSALPFVSAPSANAILSDLRPTTLTAGALDYVNEFLDELLVSLITAARSINPTHLRTRGVPAVFNSVDRDGTDHQSHSSVGALGRSAVGEAEVEIRGWYESHPTAQKGVSGFPPSGTGSGLLANGSSTIRLASNGSNGASNAAFPVHEAVELMRIKVAMFSVRNKKAPSVARPQVPTHSADAVFPDGVRRCFPDAVAGDLRSRSRLPVSAKPKTFAPYAPSDGAIEDVFRGWKSVGGDLSEETISPAGLWITAILEHISEHVLSKLSQVVARDSSVTAAGVQDLYTALCEDDSVYGFFKHMEVRKALETEIRAETKRRRPQRTASGSAVPRSSSPSDRPSTTSAGSPYGSKSSLASTTHTDNRKSLVTPARPASEHFRVVSRAPSSTQNNHKRTSSVLSISTRQPSSESNDNIFAKRFSSDKAEEDFDAFLRSGETMRVSLTPSRFSTFESPASSPSRQAELRASANFSNGLSVPPSSSESSLLSSSTQASTVDSGRFANYRQVAGRSWSSATKLMPRDAAIEEKREEEDNDERPSVMELIKKESMLKKKPSTHLARTVPAVILGTPASSPDPDDSPVASRADLPTRTASLHISGSPSVPLSEPSDSPRIHPAAFARSVRSASEGAPDLPAGSGFRRNNTVRRDNHDMQQDTRDMASFFSTPPSSTAPLHDTVPLDDSPLTPPGHYPKHRMPSLKNFMSLMKKDRTKESDKPSFKISSPQPNTQSPTPSDHGPLRALRAQKSSSSFASGSTVMALGISSTSLSTDPHPGNPQSVESPAPVKPLQLLRKPSLVRKWASQVAAGGEQRPFRRGSTPRSVTSPLPTQDEHEDTASHTSHTSLSSPHHDRSASNVSTSNASNLSHQVGGSPGRGLGLGGIDFPDAFMIREEGQMDQGPQAALAQLTAGSIKSSRPGSRADSDSPLISGRTPEFRSSSRGSVRDSPMLRASPLHHRVLELAREADDGSLSSVPPPPLVPVSPSSPEISSALGGSSVAESVASEVFVSADEMADDDRGETPEPGASTVEHGTPRLGASQFGATAPHGFVAVSDLVPLRHLLDHATSAQECQLLLDAILSQLGVPRSNGAASTPEDRVVAWLLAGREGPVGDTRPAKSRRPISRSSGMSGRRSNRPSLSSEVTMKTLPALPGRVVDLNHSAADLNGNGKERAVDAEAAAVAAAVAQDNYAKAQRMG